MQPERTGKPISCPEPAKERLGPMPVAKAFKQVVAVATSWPMALCGFSGLALKGHLDIHQILPE